MKKLHHMLMVFCFLLAPHVVVAKFIGPTTILELDYGSNDGQVGISYADTGDSYPWRFAVSSSGKVAIFDEVNMRIVLFNEDGSFQKNIFDGSNALAFDSNDFLLTTYVRKYDINGNIVGTYNLDGLYFSDIEYDYLRKEIILTKNDYEKENIIGYTVLNNDLNVISESNKLPFELGVTKYDHDSIGNQIVNVVFNDITFTIKSDSGFSFQKTLEDFLMLSEGNYIDIYDRCSNKISHLVLEKNQVFVTDAIPETGTEPYVFTHYEHGEPQFDPFGNAFMWERYPSKYKIVKWTWVDDPNDPQPGPDAPANLKLTPSLEGLYLSWEASPNDPGCVDGYELERATSVDGIYATITTTDTGDLKFNDTGTLPGTTYYYKVRAKSGGTYSPYTNTVNGSR